MRSTVLRALSTAICAIGLGVLPAAGAQPGDVNGDNAVDLLDALDLARYLAGTVASLPRLDLADVNNDGAVNEADRQFLLRSVIYCVTLDSDPPVVSIVSPEEGTTVRSTPVFVTSRVTDASPIRSVTCHVGNSSINAGPAGGDRDSHGNPAAALRRGAATGGRGAESRCALKGVAGHDACPLHHDGETVTLKLELG